MRRKSLGPLWRDYLQCRVPRCVGFALTQGHHRPLLLVGEINGTAVAKKNIIRESFFGLTQFPRDKNL